MVHHDPTRIAAIRELRERYPLRAGDTNSRIGDVLQTGESELIQVTDELAAATWPSTPSICACCARSAWAPCWRCR